MTIDAVSGKLSGAEAPGASAVSSLAVSSGLPAVVLPGPSSSSAGASVAVSPSSRAAASAATAAAAAVAAASGASAPAGRPSQTNRKRCFCCNKKVGLLGFECRCGYVFCSSHRQAEEHRCDFDYASAGRARIAAQNPVVAAEKVQRF